MSNSHADKQIKTSKHFGFLKPVDTVRCETLSRCTLILKVTKHVFADMNHSYVEPLICI